MCVLAILSVGPHFQGPAPGWCAGLAVRVRPRDIEDVLAAADDAGEVAIWCLLSVLISNVPGCCGMAKFSDLLNKHFI